MRLAPEAYEHRAGHDDLLALADAVREAARPAPEPVAMPEPAVSGAGRRSHLRVLRSE